MKAASLAVGLAILVVGCGDGDEEVSSIEAPPIKAEFIKQANATCERERAGLTERVADFERVRAPGKPLPKADAVHFVYLPTMEAQIWRIEQLEVPRGEQGRVDAMLDAERQAVDTVAVIDRVPAIATAERYFRGADRLFRRYGLQACANGPA